jgi:hypothetical protein
LKAVGGWGLGGLLDDGGPTTGSLGLAGVMAGHVAKKGPQGEAGPLRRPRMITTTEVDWRLREPEEALPCHLGTREEDDSANICGRSAAATALGLWTGSPPAGKAIARAAKEGAGWTETGAVDGTAPWGTRLGALAGPGQAKKSTFNFLAPSPLSSLKAGRTHRPRARAQPPQRAPARRPAPLHSGNTVARHLKSSAIVHSEKMGLSLWNLFKAGLLVMNALAVLHPQRFLRICESGWGWACAPVKLSSPPCLIDFLLLFCFLLAQMEWTRRHGRIRRFLESSSRSQGCWW